MSTTDDGSLRGDAQEIVLLRAGPTAWEREGRLCGAADLPLDEGVASVLRRAAEQGLGEDKPRLVLTAPGEACQQAGEVLVGRFGSKTKVVAGLREVGLGLWEGVRGDELDERCPSAYRQWKIDPASVDAPEGENLGDAQARLVAALDGALGKKRQGTVVVVLRSMAWGLVKLWCEGRAISELWDEIETDSVSAHGAFVGPRAQPAARA